MAKDRQHRGFTYHYDLGTVKVSKPFPKSLGRLAKVWLDCLGLSGMDLMLIARKEHDPLSSGSGSLLFKGEEMLPSGDGRRISARDFDCICIMVENDAEGGLFKNRERMEKIVLRELVYVAYPETKSNPESSRRIAEDIVARTRR